MFGKMISLMALVPMLFHSIWGCCWHHGHPVEDRSPVAAVSRPSEGEQESSCRTHARHACCGSHGRHAATAEAPASEDQHPAGVPCEEERCVYSDLSLTPVPHPVHLDAWDTVSTLAEAPVLLRSQLTFGQRARTDLHSPAAGELRTFLQVWLV